MRTSALDRDLTQEERFPLLGDADRTFLSGLYEHPNAPRLNHRCGDRLSAGGLERVREFESALKSRPAGDPARPWLRDFAAFCLREVPFYRARGGSPDDFTSLPTCVRADLAREPWSFVPDAQPLDDLVVYSTSGTTTGRPLDVLSHPETSSMVLPLLLEALRREGLAIEGGARRVAIVLVCWQRKTFTYASLSAFLGGAGFLKLNLDPGDWGAPSDREAFLDGLAPEVYTGDPLAFRELAKLPLKSRPTALVSTAMSLLPGLRAELEARFGCPVLDLYSLNESGPVGVSRGGPFRVLPHDLHVEVLDRAGNPCPEGARGEVTLTGGRNPFLPLLRYRTGDFAALVATQEGLALDRLEGRAPVVFRAAGAGGVRVNNVDVAGALKDLALAEYSLLQKREGSLVFAARGARERHAEIAAALAGVLGPLPLTVEELEERPPEHKLLPFRCELEP